MNSSNRRQALILGGGIAIMVAAACLILLLAALVFNAPRMAGRRAMVDRRAAPPVVPAPTPAPDNRDDRFKGDPRNDNYRGERDGRGRREGRRFQRDRGGFGPLGIIGAALRCLLALGLIGGITAIVVWLLRRNSAGTRRQESVRQDAATPAQTDAPAASAPTTNSPTDADSSNAKPPEDPAASI
jgi:hypothetical protein